MVHDVSSFALEESLVARFEVLPENATSAAGGKGACLSRMARAGLPVPPGFVICASAFRMFLARNNGVDFIATLTSDLSVHDDAALDAVSGKIREFILTQPIPPDLESAIMAAYADMGGDTLVAVRSSAVSEDGENASFAGQQETFLNIRGGPSVVRHVKECWASFFTPRALFYRSQKGALTDTRMAVVVQEMVQPDKSGVMFTIDPVQKQREHMVVEAIYGLGEAIVSGQLTPNHYVINRADGLVVREFVPVQPTILVFDPVAGRTVEKELPDEQGRARVLSDAELGRLREMGVNLEKLFGSAQDVEWCIRNGDLLLLQSRPITTL